ncbi:cell surface protein SprA [Candidatus Latescibacterota bacterium]
MYKYVYFVVHIFVFCCAGLPSQIHAQFINTERIRDKVDLRLEGEDYDIKPDEYYIETFQEFSDQESIPDLFTVGIRPPKKFPQPLTAVTDSIDINNAKVRRKTEIPGIRVEKYYFMPLEDYKQERFKVQRETLWGKNDTRMRKWGGDSTKDEGTNLSDLQFALPVGQRFESIVGGKTRLDISGRQKITFSGKSEWTEGQIETSVSKNSSFPSLTMKQEPQFSISGNVGDRITIDVKQDSRSQSFSNLEENVSLKYKGKDNEIIQSIDAGNTRLSIPGATFAGYSGTHKGLFGIRTEGRLGPLKFTAIASQEKSEANVKSFRGSAEESSNQIRDYQYKTNTYFFLDKKYMNAFAEDRTSLDLIQVNLADSVEVLEVYVDDGNSGNNLNEDTFALRGVSQPMYLDETERIHDPQGVDGFYHRLDPQRDYYVDRNIGFIVFTNRIQDAWTIGIYMRTKSGAEYGNLAYDPNDDASQINLKLVKAKNQRPSNKDTWDLEWKNVYDLGQRNIDLEGLEIRVYREATDGVSRDTQDGVPFIHILGLDNADEFGNPNPDNKIDLNRAFVNQYRGELVFPLLRPFDSDPPDAVKTELREKIPEIYETNNQEEKIEASKYYIEVKTANRSAVIRLSAGMGGIMEGTEQIILNGNQLSSGSDYRINYQSGEVTLLNEEALSPTADLVIKYEEMNSFQQMQKTLLGFRGEYDLFSESRIGATFLFNNESTREKRVRLGQEPSRMILFDTDMLLKFQPRILTTAVDLLPFVEANQQSNFQLEAEIARSMPTMNTKGVVYVDDFEGSSNTPLSVTRTNWTHASVPDPSTTGGFPLKRGRFLWYNPWDRIDSRDIWPNKETTAGENTVHVMTLAYGKPADVHEDEAFGGVQTAFYGAGEDLSRARFLEVWARGGRGKLNIDIGSLSEDFFPFDEPNGVLDTEDEPIPGQGQGNNELEPHEDTGLDGVFDEFEEGVGEDPSGDNWNYSNKSDFSHINGMEGNGRDSDRAGFPDTEDINNNGILDIKNSYYEYTIDFEDNTVTNEYLIPDSVPTGKPTGWRLFRIPLWNNPDVVIGGAGAPDSTLIEFTRMWVTGTDSTYIQIASIEVVENKWLERELVDSELNDVTVEAAQEGEIFRVTRVNTDENLNYTPPPGVKIEIDPDTKVRRMEQSLVMEFEKLSPGNTAFMSRTFEKMDFTDYSTLRMYVHGSDTYGIPDESEGGRDVELIFRFGGDKDNYYEYRTPVYKDWARESYVDIDFPSFTAVKFDFEENRDDLNRERGLVQKNFDAVTDSVLAEDNSKQAVKDSLTIVLAELDEQIAALNLPGAYADTTGSKVLTMSGSPSLQNIKVISIGIRNNHENEQITGDVWFDEMRMDALREMTGTAGRVKLNTDLAGFINLTGNATTKSKDFHDMNTKKGTGKDTFDWNSTVKVNLDRITPLRWNLNIPMSMSVSGSEALPWLKSGSDIILPADEKKAYATETSDKKYHFSYRKNVDSSRPKDTFFRKVKDKAILWSTEKVNADFDWGERSEKSPFSGISKKNSTQVKATYDVRPVEKNIKPFEWISKIGKGDEDEEDVKSKERREAGKKKSPLIDKLLAFQFNYTPNELNYNYTLDDNNAYNTNIDGVSDSTKTSTVNEDYNFGYRPFKSLTYRFKLTKKQDRIINQQTSYNETNTVSYKPPGFFKLFTHDYSYTTTYDEKDNPRFSVSSQLGSKTINFRNSVSATVNVTWYNILDKLKYVPKLEDEEDKKKKEKGGKKDVKDKTDKEGENEEGAKKPEKPEPEKKPEVKKETAAADTTDSKPKIPLRNKAIDGLMKIFTPIALQYNSGETLNYGGIKERPETFLDRFTGKVDEPDSSTIITRQNTFAGNTGYSARTDLKLPFDMGVSTQARYDLKDQTSSSANTEDLAITYPDVTFRWQNVDQKIPFIKRYLTKVNLNSTYSRNSTKSWQDEADVPTADKSSVKISQSINTVVMKKLQTTVSLSLGEETSADLSGQTKSFTISENSDIKTTLRYSINASRGFLFFKNMKLSSNIDLALEFGLTKNARWKKIGEDEIDDTGDGTGDGTGDETGTDSGGDNIVAKAVAEPQESRTEMRDGYSKIDSNDAWYVTPNISYSFSRKFKGGAKIDIRDSVDQTGKKHKMREVQIWGELTF